MSRLREAPLPIQGCIYDIIENKRWVHQVDKLSLVTIGFHDYVELKANNVAVHRVGYAQHSFRVEKSDGFKVEGMQCYQTCDGDTRLFWKDDSFSIPQGTKVGVNKKNIHSVRLLKTPSS